MIISITQVDKFTAPDPEPDETQEMPIITVEKALAAEEEAQSE